MLFWSRLPNSAKVTDASAQGQDKAKTGIPTMKVSIEIDLTPQEARELLGMPNMSAVQDVFVGLAKEKLEKTASLVDVEPLLKTWTGIGGVAQDAFGAIVGAALKAATSEPSSRASSRESARSESARSESEPPKPKKPD